jgi:hypothetical protein
VCRGGRKEGNVRATPSQKAAVAARITAKETTKIVKPRMGMKAKKRKVAA